jgi:dCMP deaminase
MRPSWDKYYMNIADVVKSRSNDTKIQVGSVIVSLKDHRIISTGYNSVCAGIDDSIINWDDREHIRNLVIHSEMNAILYTQSKFEDAVIYCTLSPCKDCIKMLSATKIRKVIYKDDYKDIELVRELCKFFNIEIIKFNG